MAPHFHRQLLDAYCTSTLPSIAEEGEAGTSLAGGAAGAPFAAGARQQPPEAQGPAWAPQAAGPPPGHLHRGRPQHSLLALPASRLQDIPDDG